MNLKAYITNIEPLGDEGLFKSLYDLMPEYRKEKIDRIKSESDKRRSIAAGALLLYGARLLGLSKLPTVETGEKGKPYFKDSSVYFNLSHSGDKVLCVIGDTEAGCDIENLNRKYDTNVAKRFFSSSEVKALEETTNEDEKKELFFKLWTLKESFVKLKGDGLSRALDSFSFKESCGKIVLACEDGEDDCRFVNRFTDDNYCYSVAFKGDLEDIEAEHLDIEKIRNYLYEA